MMKKLYTFFRNSLRDLYLTHLYLRRYPEEITYLHPVYRFTDEGFIQGQAARKRIALHQMQRGFPSWGESFRDVIEDPHQIHFFFPPAFSWNEMAQRPHHIARVLSEAGFVCWFGIPRREWRNHSQPVHRVDQGVIVVKDMFRIYPVVSSSRRWWWINTPLCSVYADLLSGGGIVYDLCDHLKLDACYGDALLQTHHRLMQKSDLVVVSSSALLKHVGERRDVIVAPNGVWLNDFRDSNACEETVLQIPYEKIQSFRAAIGYAGALAPWFDWDLVKSCADRYPDILFLLIGPLLGRDPKGDGIFPYSKIEPRDLFRMKNVYWMGSKPYRQIPALLRTCTGTMIPFKRHEIIDAVSPVKLFESSALGLPVLSTAMPECKRENLGLVCDTDEEFVNAIPKLCEWGRDVERRKQIALAVKECSWQKRLAPVVERIRSIVPATDS